jgi:hypothetical protein
MRFVIIPAFNTLPDVRNWHILVMQAYVSRMQCSLPVPGRAALCRLHCVPRMLAAPASVWELPGGAPHRYCCGHGRVLHVVPVRVMQQTQRPFSILLVRFVGCSRECKQQWRGQA